LSIRFWPAFFFLNCDAEEAVEYARVKGDIGAVERAYIKLPFVT
jgi:hypothetical protein